MSNPNSLLLLADHIKLSLLEQQRAKALNLARDPQDGHIARSLDQFREGIESLEKEYQRLQEAGDESYAAPVLSLSLSLSSGRSDNMQKERPLPSATPSHPSRRNTRT